jgi:hypothetical protein
MNDSQSLNYILHMYQGQIGKEFAVQTNSIIDSLLTI